MSLTAYGARRRLHAGNRGQLTLNVYGGDNKTTYWLELAVNNPQRGIADPFSPRINWGMQLNNSSTSGACASSSSSRENRGPEGRWLQRLRSSYEINTAIEAGQTGSGIMGAVLGKESPDAWLSRDASGVCIRLCSTHFVAGKQVNGEALIHTKTDVLGARRVVLYIRAEEAANCRDYRLLPCPRIFLHAFRGSRWTSKLCSYHGRMYYTIMCQVEAEERSFYRLLFGLRMKQPERACTHLSLEGDEQQGQESLELPGFPRRDRYKSSSEDLTTREVCELEEQDAGDEREEARGTEKCPNGEPGVRAPLAAPVPKTTASLKQQARHCLKKTQQRQKSGEVEKIKDTFKVKRKSLLRSIVFLDFNSPLTPTPPTPTRQTTVPLFEPQGPQEKEFDDREDGSAKEPEQLQQPLNSRPEDEEGVPPRGQTERSLLPPLDAENHTLALKDLNRGEDESLATKKTEGKSGSAGSNSTPEECDDGLETQRTGVEEAEKPDQTVPQTDVGTLQQIPHEPPPLEDVKQEEEQEQEQSQPEQSLNVSGELSQGQHAETVNSLSAEEENADDPITTRHALQGLRYSVELVVISPEEGESPALKEECHKTFTRWGCLPGGYVSACLEIPRQPVYTGEPFLALLTIQNNSRYPLKSVDIDLIRTTEIRTKGEQFVATANVMRHTLSVPVRPDVKDDVPHCIRMFTNRSEQPTTRNHLISVQYRLQVRFDVPTANPMTLESELTLRRRPAPPARAPLFPPAWRTAAMFAYAHRVVAIQGLHVNTLTFADVVESDDEQHLQ